MKPVQRWEIWPSSMHTNKRIPADWSPAIDKIRINKRKNNNFSRPKISALVVLLSALSYHLAINFSFDTHTDLVSCRCQFTLIFRFSSISRYQSKDCDKLGTSERNLKDEFSPFHRTTFHAGFSDFPTKESLFLELFSIVDTTSLGCCKSAPKKSNSRIVCFKWKKNFSLNNNYALNLLLR